MTATTQLVSQQFSNAQSYADSAWDMAEQFLNTLEDAVTAPAPEPANLTYTFEPLTSGVLSPSKPTAPGVGTISVSVPSQPNFDTVTFSPVTVPQNTTPALTVTIPNAPTTFDPSDPGNAPSIGAVNIPGPPSLTFPSEPSIVDWTIPTKPSLSIPTFSAVMPVDNIVSPTNSFAYSEGEYQSTMLDEVKAKLSADLAAGGTGLGETAEAAIWNRMLTRQAELEERLFTTTAEFFSSRGWNIPTGAMSAKITEAHNEAQRALANANYEIAIEQARLAYQNVQDTIKSIIALEQALIQHSDVVANRALEAAKYTIEAAVNIFNAQIAKLEMSLEVYKTAASVYEVQVRVQEIIMSLYTAELNAVKTGNEIDLTKIEKYKAILSGVQQRVEVYKAELQGAATVAQVEALRVESFKAVVDAFTAKINGNTAKYNMYQAQIAGELAKAQVYSEQIRAFATEVEAAKTKSTIEKDKAEVAVSINDNRTKVYLAQIEAYKADLQGQIAVIEAKLSEYATKGKLYDSDINLAVGAAEMNIKANEANLRTLLAQLELELKQAEVNMQNAVQSNALSLEAAKVGSTVTAQLAASALSSVNASASQNASSSESWDQTKGTPTYSHIYNYNS